MTTIERIKIAFRKLKASVYFDKTILPLRDKVVEFEVSIDFESNLQKLANAVDAAALDENSDQMKNILESIAVLSFPKKMVTAESSESAIISVGNPKEKPVVKELQHFIEMDVRGHILGILWIMSFGKQLDEKCYGHSFGNRLRKSLIWDMDSDEVRNSPALFEPYFSQYSLWRDDALKCAEGLLSNGHDTLIVTLDLKRFYYNTGITEEVFNKLLDDDISDNERALHFAVFAILKRYSELLVKRNVDNSGVVLPIGFLPSAVLSNWCLTKFDSGILDFWNPSYYGRYVDDIIIVEKLEKGSEIYKLARSEATLSKDYVIDYFLGGKRHDETPWFAKKGIAESPSSVDCLSIDETPSTSATEDDLYTVNPVFCLSHRSRLMFQPVKSRIITLFSDNNSTALINKFKKEIYENVSEFRLMPEVGDAFSQDDFSQFYRLDNDATVNKLRGVKDIKIDKYELSKFLGKYRAVSSLVDDGSIKKFTRIIGRMFNDRELIENYILWERIFEIFITDKDYVGFAKFVKRINDAIDAISLNSDIKETISKSDVQVSLQRHLRATLNRTLSLVWGDNVKKRFSSVINDLDVQLRGKYIETQMSNKYVTTVPMDIIAVPLDDNNVNFTDFVDTFEYLKKAETRQKPESSDYEYLPYFRQAHDIALSMRIKSLLGDDYNDTSYIDSIFKAVTDNDPQVSLNDVLPSGRQIIVDRKPLEKLRVAVANVNVSKVYNMDSVLRGRKPNRTYARYRDLANIVNMAIKENADMLVLPENYVPFEWILPLSAKAAREGLAIIAGVEHLIVGGDVYNYTAVILPFKYLKSIPSSAVFYQLKNHYSPEERHLIEGYSMNVPTKADVRPLYRWHDCYFPVYCCYELTAILERAEYLSWADMVVAVEFNKDTIYFGNIVESLVRDLHCYCVQVNTSEYGDSRITRPTRSEERDILTVKGGLNQTLLVGEIDIKALREFQLKTYSLQKGGAFKPTPPGIDINIVRQKLNFSK